MVVPFCERFINSNIIPMPSAHEIEELKKKEFVRTEEAATMTGRSYRTISRMINKWVHSPLPEHEKYYKKVSVDGTSKFYYLLNTQKVLEHFNTGGDDTDSSGDRFAPLQQALQILERELLAKNEQIARFQEDRKRTDILVQQKDSMITDLQGRLLALQAPKDIAPEQKKKTLV